LLAAVGLHVNWLEGHHGYLPGSWDVLWSLSVEESFYLVFPLACLLLRSRTALLALLAALVVVGPVSRMFLSQQDPWGTYAWLSCTDGMAFGCLAAFLAERWRSTSLQRLLLLAAGLPAMVLVLWFRKQLAISGLRLDVTVLEAGAALVLIAARHGAGAWMERPLAPLLLLGRCSYEVYLTHMFVVLGAVALAPVGLAESASLPAWYAGVVVASGALGWLVARCFSTPLNAALRRRWLAAAPAALAFP
jgi:peptidoglycan/LPS O-acetylase OafA/YrhL